MGNRRSNVSAILDKVTELERAAEERMQEDHGGEDPDISSSRRIK